MNDGFPKSWTAEILQAAPMIAPARQFIYPMEIAGEEDALARGALQVMVRPRLGGAFLATFALGFQDPSMPTGIFAAPGENELCALAGGYAYVIDTLEPKRCTLLNLKPATSMHVAREAGLLVFTGFQTLMAWGTGGVRWQTERLSWEGVRVTDVTELEARGFGWDLMTDKEVPFAVDLTTGRHSGGAFGGAGRSR